MNRGFAPHSVHRSNPRLWPRWCQSGIIEPTSAYAPHPTKRACSQQRQKRAKNAAVQKSIVAETPPFLHLDLTRLCGGVFRSFPSFPSGAARGTTWPRPPCTAWDDCNSRVLGGACENCMRTGGGVMLKKDFPQPTCSGCHLEITTAIELADRQLAQGSHCLLRLLLACSCQ